MACIWEIPRMHPAGLSCLRKSNFFVKHKARIQVREGGVRKEKSVWEVISDTVRCSVLHWDTGLFSVTFLFFDPPHHHYLHNGQEEFHGIIHSINVHSLGLTFSHKILKLKYRLIKLMYRGQFLGKLSALMQC